MVDIDAAGLDLPIDLLAGVAVMQGARIYGALLAVLELHLGHVSGQGVLAFIAFVLVEVLPPIAELLVPVVPGGRRLALDRKALEHCGGFGALELCTRVDLLAAGGCPLYEQWLIGCQQVWSLSDLCIR